MPIITLQNNSVTARISTLGAELISLTDSNGVERIWEGDPAVWSGRAPVLFPVAGAFNDNYYMLNGVRYDMPKHGFAKTSEFIVEKNTHDSAVFSLDRKHEGFPFDYILRIIFTLTESGLHIEYGVSNTGTNLLYYGLGCHEAYACPEGIEQYLLRFDREETLRASVLRGSQITYETETIIENSYTLPLERELFVPDALVFLDVRSRGVILVSTCHNRTVKVDFEDFNYLLIWTKPNAKFICIEPWCNPPEYIDFDHDITHKPGVILLHPGESDCRSHTISLG